MIFRLFPHEWDRRKVSEVRLAIYQTFVGALFWAYPEGLGAPVYAPWHAIASPREWAAGIFVVVVLHSIAILTNGRSVLFSSSVRAMACTSHLIVGITFALLFASSGAWWGTITYTVLVIWPLFGALGYTMEKFVEAVTCTKNSPQV